MEQKTKKTVETVKFPKIVIKKVNHVKVYRAESWDLFVACWGALACIIATFTTIFLLANGQILAGILSLIILFVTRTF
jgi:hypothetical protein